MRDVVEGNDAGSARAESAHDDGGNCRKRDGALFHCVLLPKSYL